MEKLKYEIDLSAIDAEIIKPRHYFLLQLAKDSYVALQAVRTHINFLQYNFSAEKSNWLPLDAVGGTGASGVSQAAYLESQNITISDLSIDNNAFSIKTRENNIIQAWYGLKPSYLLVNRRFPSTTPVDQLPESSLHPSSSYIWVYGVSGFRSPYYRPSPETEFVSFANTDVYFDLANTAPFLVQPELFFVMNNVLVQPIKDKSIIAKILTPASGIPRKIIDTGQIYGSVPWSSSSYEGIVEFTQADILAGGK